MGNKSKGLRAVLPGGRSINQKSQRVAAVIDTSMTIEQHLAKAGLSLESKKQGDLDRYTSGLLAFYDASRRGESKANALQAGLSATKTSVDTLVQQAARRDRKLAKEHEQGRQKMLRSKSLKTRKRKKRHRD